MKTILEFDHKKAVQAINFLAHKEKGKIDKLKAVKLVWLVDRYHIRKYGRPVFNDTYYAMKLGPVASSIKDLLGFNVLSDIENEYLDKNLELLSENCIRSKSAVNEDVFSDTDIEALQAVYGKYGGFSAPNLVDFSHKFPEWNKFKSSLVNGQTTREVMSYLDFFDNPEENISNNIFVEDKDNLEISKQIFKDNFKIAQYWS